MSGACEITNNDLVLYLSVLIVLILIFPLLDLLIVRVAWLYKDELSLLGEADPITRKDSYFSRARTASSFSNRSQHVHPMQKTTATLIFSNEESRELDAMQDSMRSREESIVYGKSFPRHLSIRGADIEVTSRFIRSADEVHIKKKFAETVFLPSVSQGRVAKKIDALPAIETPAIREISVRKRTEKVSVTRDGVEAMYSEDTLTNTLTDRVTLVTPVSERDAAVAAAYQSSEFVERLAGTSLLYQERKSPFNMDASSKTNLVEASSRDSTPVLGERKLLHRPDNTRRKVNRLGTTQSPSTSPK